jgi:hypothetical protein
MTIDNSIFRKANDFFPVPAIVGSSTFVDYYNYIDIRNALKSSNPQADDASIKKAVLDELKKGKEESYSIWSLVE